MPFDLKIAGCRHMQPFADAEGHILLEPAGHHDLFKCTRESETDKLQRDEQALSLLAVVQQVFNQARERVSCICSKRTFLHCK